MSYKNFPKIFVLWEGERIIRKGFEALNESCGKTLWGVEGIL